jgi:acetyl-CoA carboxylase biotin carboxyl carrier protein
MAKNTEQDVAFITALAELLTSSELSEIDVEREYGENDELKVRLSRNSAPAAPVVYQQPAAAPAITAAPVAQPEAPQPMAAAASGPDLSKAVTSPMVGTVYLAAEPGTPPFVSTGDTVAEGDTILIIEAMKTMNQIPAPRSGVVKTIMVDNAEPVEFGEALMIIE